MAALDLTLAALAAFLPISSTQAKMRRRRRHRAAVCGIPTLPRHRHAIAQTPPRPRLRAAPSSVAAGTCGGPIFPRARARSAALAFGEPTYFFIGLFFVGDKRLDEHVVRGDVVMIVGVPPVPGTGSSVIWGFL